MDKDANYLRRQGRLPPNLLRYVSPLGWHHAERMNARPLNLYVARIRAQQPGPIRVTLDLLSVILDTSLAMTPVAGRRGFRN